MGSDLLTNLNCVLKTLYNSTLHSLTGPSVTIGDIHTYYINGNPMNFEEWNVHPEVVAYRNEKKLKDKLGV